jgi:hypothetical protein
MKYSDALGRFLKDTPEAEFAARVGCAQSMVNRYRHAQRFPSARVARAIDRESGGAVPFDLWRDEFLRRAGVEQ